MSIWRKKIRKNQNDQMLKTTDFTENVREISNYSGDVRFGGVETNPFLQESILVTICFNFALSQV
jgi:hypothetical protein